MPNRGPAVRLLRLLLLFSVVGVGCSESRKPSRAALPEVDVEMSGCAALVAPAIDGGALAPSCLLADDRRLRLVVADGPGRLAFFAHDTPLTASPTPVAFGTRFELRVPDGTTELVVRRLEAALALQSTTIRFVPSPRPVWFGDAQTRRKKGDLAGAEGLARAALDAPRDTERAAAFGLLARVALRRGEVSVAAEQFRAAMALDERAGLVSDRADDAFALAFLLHQRASRYAEARRVLIEVEPWLVAYPEGRANAPLYRAQIAWQSGDTRAAMRDLELSISRAERLGAASIARLARQVRSMVSCSAGSAHVCVASLREADTALSSIADAPACERAELLVSLGFAELEVAEVDGVVPTDLGRADERALEVLDHGCPDPYLRALAHQHLAMAAVLRRDPVAAKKHLAEARARAKQPRRNDAVTWLDIEAHVEELEGKPARALSTYDAAVALAHASALRTKEVRALVGKGRLLEGSGRNEAAVAAFREAEGILDDVVAMVPFGEGRAGAASDGAEGVRRAAGILVAQGKTDEALAMVRHARGRLLRSLATSAKIASFDGPARDAWDRSVADYRAARAAIDAEAEGDWKLSRAALDAAFVTRKAKLDALQARLDDARSVVSRGSVPSPIGPRPEGEVTLVYARLGPHNETFGFVVGAFRSRAFRVAEVTKGTAPEAVGEALLVPAWPELTHASRVRVETDGSLVGLDVHAAVVHGEPLGVRVPVVYAMDLPVARSPAATGRPRALVVTDPTGDLPSARAEGADVMGAIATTYEARALVGREAKAPEVRAALGNDLALFHYAGHGVFRGPEGADSFLPLAQGSALTLGDILTLSRGPRSVVLSGCEAGRQTGAFEEAVAGIAQAFLVAGAETVVAPVHIVDDVEAASLTKALYSETHVNEDGGPSRSVADALHAAQAKAFRAGRPWWSGFRAFSRR
jgi:cellulose synthase operon protein C